MSKENPNNELQDIVDFMERDYGDEDREMNNFDGIVDWSAEED